MNREAPMLLRVFNLLSEFSIPLIAGVITGIFFANVNSEAYNILLNTELLSDFKIFGHPITFKFIMNDIFMIFFFGIATVEIVRAIIPGGSLNPVKKAINPLIATLGGVFGPICVYWLLCFILNQPEALNGWGIPTATDIALAWLVARYVFGSKHPAVAFLLLLAVVDDAIGLAIIAIFYPDPSYPVQVIWLLLVAWGTLNAYLLRRKGVTNMWLYLLFGGVLSWSGLVLAHLHPALALVFIIPFMPSIHGNRDGLFEDTNSARSPLRVFEYTFQHFVAYGLFGFGLVNAGVEFSNIQTLTWIVFFSLFIGKTLGISLFAHLGVKMGFPLPDGLSYKVLTVASMIAGVGLTVALFVAGEAFTDPNLSGSAKMGALFSAGIAFIAIIIGRIFAIDRIHE